MDMTRYLKAYLNVRHLQDMGGEYVGVIENVVETEMRNTFTKQPSKEAVIQFRDGQRMVLNIGMVRECIRTLGTDSLTWSGHQVRVFCAPVDQVNSKTGKSRQTWHRKIECRETPIVTDDDVFGKK